MFCGSVKDFDILLGKFNFIEKKLKSLQKNVKILMETIDDNQAEIKGLLKRTCELQGEKPVGMKEKDYCSIRL